MSTSLSLLSVFMVLVLLERVRGADLSDESCGSLECGSLVVHNEGTCLPTEGPGRRSACY